MKRRMMNNAKQQGTDAFSLIRMIALFVLLSFPPTLAVAVTTLSISQIPLKLASPTHPQVLIAIGNSESMDGTLSGAIMVGSGSIPSSVNSLQNSSSPLNYTVPAGFTPPAQAATLGQAPYTVTQSGNLVDNGPSRLNMAKAGVQAIIQSYMQSTDFALEVYNTNSTAVYTTWVYYMSPQTGNFTFANTPVGTTRYVTNPCFAYSQASSTVASNCSSIASLYGATTLSTNQSIAIGASSDDSNINDVLYTSGLSGVFVSFNGPSPASPYPPNFSLSNYNNGGVTVTYARTSPNNGSFGTSPTNAGFVPFSPQVMYARRGFGYGGGQSSTTGKVIVPMTTAGVVPTLTSLTTAINTFTPFLAPETNKLSTTEVKAVAGQSPIPGLLTTARTYLTNLAFTGCVPQRYVILITDGLPTQDLSGKFWPPLGSASAIGYGVTATFNPDGSLNTTNAKALTDTITALANLKNAGIKTYIIGLGAGVDPSLNPQAAATLTAMAVAGGTINYYPAKSPTDLVSNLNSILISVQNGSYDTTSAAVSSTSLQNGVIEYQTTFTSSDLLYQDWTGNVYAKSLDPDTGAPTGNVLWSAQSILDANTSRVIATWNPTLNNGAGSGVPFQWLNLSAAQQLQLQPSGSLGIQRVAYLRGSSVLEQRNGGTFRNRSHILGDIHESQPVYVGPPSNPAYFNSASYLTFALTNMNRQPMLYVGANDGMLHAFNASNGVEAFAFIPNGVFDNLDNLTSPQYNLSHLFFVDGSPQSADVQYADASWHTLLVGGEGGGGKSIYAIDITNPTSITNDSTLASSVLWEFTDPDLGLTYSLPKIGQISTTSTAALRFGVFFGNGYNSTNNKAILYAVDPQTGSTIGKIDLCAAVPGTCSTTSPQGLSTVTLGQLDGLQNQPITQVYAGDLQGNVWAIDTSNTSPSLWKVRLLFQAKDILGNPQSITTAPAVTLNPNYPRSQGLFVMFGTGQLLTQSDLSNTQRQTVYGIWDKSNASTAITRSNLQSQTLSRVTASTSGLLQDILTSTTNTINWNNAFGWFDDLPVNGQRVITDPQVSSGSFITILNTPPQVSCGLPGAVLLDLNYLTGGAFTRQQLDINNNGTIDSNDQYLGKNPVGIALTPGYASAPVTTGITSAGYLARLVTSSSGQQTSIINPNNNVRQTAWWQIQ